MRQARQSGFAVRPRHQYRHPPSVSASRQDLFRENQAAGGQPILRGTGWEGPVSAAVAPLASTAGRLLEACAGIAT